MTIGDTKAARQTPMLLGMEGVLGRDGLADREEELLGLPPPVSRSSNLPIKFKKIPSHHGIKEQVVRIGPWPRWRAGHPCPEGASLQLVARRWRLPVIKDISKSWRGS